MVNKEDLEQLKVKPGDPMMAENFNNIVNALIEILDKILEMDHDISMLELKN